MNATFAAINVIAIVAIATFFVLPRIRERRGTMVEVPRSIRPSRPGQELTDVVTEWAKATGVLNPDGTVDPKQAAERSNDLTDERA